MTGQKLAYIYAILAVIFWSTVASAFKLTLKHIDYMGLVLYSSATSFIVLFIIIAIQGKAGMIARVSRRDIARSAWLGMLNPFLYYIVLFAAYSLLTGQEAVTMNYTWPIWLAVLSAPLLRQRIGWKSIGAIVISFAGVFIIATRGDVLGFRFTSGGGAALALGSAVIWAIYWIFNVRDELDAIVRLWLNFLFGTLYIFITMIILGTLSAPNAGGLLGAVYVGIFEMGVTFAVWLKALKLSRTTAEVSNLIYAAPFLSLVVLSVVVKERIMLSTLVGLVFIMAGIILQRRFSKV